MPYEPDDDKLFEAAGYLTRSELAVVLSGLRLLQGSPDTLARLKAAMDKFPAEQRYDLLHAQDMDKLIAGLWPDSAAMRPQPFVRAPGAAPTVDSRKLAAVLTGLRLLQKNRGEVLRDEALLAVLTDGGELTPPSDAEIDELCEELNA